MFSFFKSFFVSFIKNVESYQDKPEPVSTGLEYTNIADRARLKFKRLGWDRPGVVVYDQAGTLLLADKELGSEYELQEINAPVVGLTYNSSLYRTSREIVQSYAQRIVFCFRKKEAIGDTAGSKVTFGIFAYLSGIKHEDVGLLHLADLTVAKEIIWKVDGDHRRYTVISAGVSTSMPKHYQVKYRAETDGDERVVYISF